MPINRTCIATEAEAEALREEQRQVIKRLKDFRSADPKDITLERRDQNRRDIKRAGELEELMQLSVNPCPYVPGGDNGGPLDTRNLSDHREAKGYQMRAWNQPKGYRDLFGKEPLNDYRWQDKEVSFWEALFSKRHHPGLTQRSLYTGVPSSGGFLVPQELAQRILDLAPLEDEVVFPRATVIAMKSETLELPAFELGDHSSSLFGGFTATYSPEEGTLSQSTPKFMANSLTARKLYGFLKFSNELLSNLGDDGRQIIDVCAKGLAWYRDNDYLTGSGAGKPLGVLNAPCTVEVAAEVGQASATIVYANLLKMLARLHTASFGRAVWVAHPSTIPMLATLTVDVGTGGSHIPVMRESDGKFQILTRPVIFTEKLPALGTKGDILLADFSQYVIGLKEEIRIDLSGHFYFDTDHTACRMIFRHDGQPLWHEPLTLKDGSTTVSPFVVLAAR